MSFYERLTELREKQGLTQKELADLLNLNKNSFTHWKRGTLPQRDTRKSLANFFGVSVDYLMGESDNPTVEGESSDDNTVDRIREEAQKQGKTVTYLCSLIGRPKYYFNDLKKTRADLAREDLKIIAGDLKVSPEYLEGKTVVPFPSNEQKQHTIRDVPLGDQIAAYYPYEPQGMRPIVGITSAGNGIFAQESILGWEAVDAKYNNDNYFWLKVSGDSMSPKIDDGDLVLIQKDGQMENGCLGIVLVDDSDAFLKQLYVDNESITLHSFNLYYPNRVFKKEEQNRLRFIGRARQVKRLL